MGGLYLANLVIGWAEFNLGLQIGVKIVDTVMTQLMFRSVVQFVHITYDASFSVLEVYLLNSVCKYICLDDHLTL